MNPTDASREHLLGLIDKADAECDTRIRSWKSRSILDENQRLLRDRAVVALGGFPSVKCPLNARTLGTVSRSGYCVEKVMFESFANVHVTANLFLPDAARFSFPRPALLLACGHAQNGKGAPAYQRGAVLAAQAGFVCLIFDPFDQGERFQGVCPERGCSADHDHISSLQTLLGGTFLRYLIWDSIRAIDYLVSRPEVDVNRIGMWGNSGGGQATEWTAALDNRVKAAVISGAITTQSLLNRENSTPVTGWTEFSVDNQFALGLNHTALLLMAAPSPVLVESCKEDCMFPIRGARSTVETVRSVLATCGLPEHCALLEVEGPHKWCESARRAGVDWFQRALCDNCADKPFDVSRYSAFDIAFNADAVDMGLTDGAEFVTEKGNVLGLPNERTIYDVMRDELKSHLPHQITADEVAQHSGIRIKFAKSFVRSEVSRHITNGITLIRESFIGPDGFAVPVLTCIPDGAAGTPCMILRNAGGAAVEEHCRAAFAAHRIVCIPDLFASGKIGGGRQDVPEFARQLGRNIPSIRAEEIIAIADDIRKRFSAAPDIVAFREFCVPAAHVRKLCSELVGDLLFCEPPQGWVDAIERGIEYDRYSSVPNALSAYDWVEL